MAWITPRLDWDSQDGVTTEDLERIEGNIYHIEKGLRTPNDSSTKYATGNLQQILDTIATQIKAILGTTSWTSNVPSALSSVYSHLVNYANPHSVRADQIPDTATKVVMTSYERSKLAGIETNATRDQTASEILALLKNVDGSGSGLDCDYIDGISPTYLAHHSFTIYKNLYTHNDTVTRYSAYTYQMDIPIPIFISSKWSNSGVSGRSGSGIELVMDVNTGTRVVTAQVKMSDGVSWDTAYDIFWVNVFSICWR